MALLKVRTYPDPVLKKKAEPLHEFGSSEQKIFDDMIETMWVEDGVGLAAPQIGFSKRILVASPSMKKSETLVFVNPEITQSVGRELGVEGCLSLPGISGEIMRAKKIHVRFLDRRGRRQAMDAKGLLARIIQHEIEHLDGILLIDRLDFNKRQQVLAGYQRL